MTHWKNTSWRVGLGLLILSVSAMAAGTLKTSRVQVGNGVLEGVISADDKVRTFKGIPYAAPPVGPLRWKEPQPAAAWSGVRPAAEYGARCMQGPIYADMVFHDDGPSENCLYLNLWMPAHPTTERLPVMVWIYGGGFNAGSSSEPRQDGGNLAKQGVMVVSMNYRLGIFGFFAHPELAKESGHDSAGNYGLLDQWAALRWVHDNIAIFGGDPNNVTIFGQSAGSSSVSALVASPLAKGLFQRAIGESGAAMNASRPVPSLAQSEKASVGFAQEAFGTSSLEELRRKPANDILNAALKAKDARFSMNADGYFLPETPLAIYSAGGQSHVPLLAGWNADEGSAGAIFGEKEVTPANLQAQIRGLFPGHEEEAIRLYPAQSDAQAKRAAVELARDRGVGSSMWKWLELQRTTGGVTTYRYEFDRPRPLPPGSTGDLEPRAYHSAEIEYVFSMLPPRAAPWSAEDRSLAELMSAYWANFAKSGNPNGVGLPKWDVYSSDDGFEVMHFNVESKQSSDQYRARYQLIAQVTAAAPPTTPVSTGRPPRSPPPTRDPHTPGYVTAKDLPDGENAPATVDGNFILGPTHNPAPEMAVKEGVPQGTVYEFTMASTDSKIYPGIAREPGTFGAGDPNDPAKMIVTSSHPAPYTRKVAVYVPKQYVPGTVAPFIVGADGPDRTLFTALDNLIAERRVPVMIAISLGNGSGDAQGSERGLEYDTMSGLYAEWVEKEVLPVVEKQYNVKLTKDPEGRATMGGSSGGSCALIMAWYHPELYHRVLTFSGTYVNQQWPSNPESPHGAWEFHEHLIPNNPPKPIRLWMEVGDRDNYNANVMRDNMHDWVVANENMAKVLAAKGYHYQFVFARNAGHTDRAVKAQTLPEALEYVWQGYPATLSKN